RSRRRRSLGDYHSAHLAKHDARRLSCGVACKPGVRRARQACGEAVAEVRREARAISRKAARERLLGRGPTRNRLEQSRGIAVLAKIGHFAVAEFPNHHPFGRELAAGVSRGGRIAAAHCDLVARSDVLSRLERLKIPGFANKLEELRHFFLSVPCAGGWNALA